MAERVYDIQDWPKMPVRDIPWLPRLPRNNDEWFDWYPKVMRHRATVLEETTSPWTGQRKAQARRIMRVQSNGKYWLNVWASIYEARPEEDDDDEQVDWETWSPEEDKFDQSTMTSGVLPFIAYPFQNYVWDWIDLRFRHRGAKGDGAVVKSRDMGMTNLVLANIGVHKWMTRRPWQVRVLSRKEDLVDETGNPDSMFWKMDMMLRGMPDWMLYAFVPRFRWPKDRTLGSIKNPANGNAVAGESTNATAGRGGRCSSMVLDRFGYMRNPGGIWTATRDSTRHRFIISSVSVSEGTFFHDLIEGSDGIQPDKQPAILRTPYYLHPYHDDLWLASERRRDTEAGIRQEIFMDWFADTSDFVYPEAHEKKVGDYPFIPYAGPLFCVFDDGFDDYWAMHYIQYIKQTGRHRVIASYHNQHQIVDYYGSIMRGVLDGRFQYDEEAVKLIRQVQQWPAATFIGDPHGSNVEQVSGMSVIERLASAWGIQVNVDFEKRLHKDRRQFLGYIIPMMDFNETEGVAWSLHSLKMYRFKKMRDGAEVTTEYRMPAHDKNSHAATAFEYYATVFDQFKFILTGGTFVYDGED